MRFSLVPAKRKPPRSDLPLTPQQLFDAAAVDNDYSKKASIRSLASRTVTLTPQAPEHGPNPVLETHLAAGHGLLTPLAGALKCLRALRRAHESIPAITSPHVTDASSAFAVASISYAEPGVWEGQKAHFIRLRLEYHPDAAHHLERVDVSVRVWKAGDALRSLAPFSNLDLRSVEPPDAPEYGSEAPPIVLFGPRAVIGRESGSKVEPYWYGQFRSGDHFIYFAEASPPRDFDAEGPITGDQPCSLLDIAAYGDHKEMRPAPSFEVGMVILSRGLPFDLTVYSTSRHWGLRGIRSYLFDPYRPAKIGPKTRLIPEGERPIAMDFSRPEMKEQLMQRVAWGKPYDTIWLGGPRGCAEKPAMSGRNCCSRYCHMCRQASGEPTA